MRCRSLLLVPALALFLGWSAARAGTTSASPPLKLSVVSAVHLAPEILRAGLKLRIRNLSSGALVIVDIHSGEATLEPGTLARLVSSNDQEWLPEFSVLRVGRRDWQVVGYRILKAPNGALYLEVSSNVRTVFITPEQAARRIEVREQNTLTKLFDLGWRSLSIERYDLGLEAFQRIFQRHVRLQEKQSAQAYLGLALAKYHLHGCAKDVVSDLVQADRDPANQDDVSYYRALCLMEDENYSEAQTLFENLVKKQNKNYAEPSAFYLGEIAESDERLDDAEAAYLDTIDQASDPGLVELAKTRLDNLRKVKARESLTSAWIFGGLRVGTAYDTNFSQLSNDVAPASFGLSHQPNFYASTVASIGLTPPWSADFTHHIHYDYFLNRSFQTAQAQLKDSQIHDVGTDVKFASAPDVRHRAAYDLKMVVLGAVGNGVQVARSQSVSYALELLGGKDPAQATSDLDLAYRLVRTAPSTNSGYGFRGDLDATGHRVSLNYTSRRNPPYAYGPDFSVEQRTVNATDDSLWILQIGAHWRYNFGPKLTPWFISEAGAFFYKPYVNHSLERHDYALEYSGALGRTWHEHLMTQLQWNGIYNFSTLKETCQFRELTLSLLVSLLF